MSVCERAARMSLELAFAGVGHGRWTAGALWASTEQRVQCIRPANGRTGRITSSGDGVDVGVSLEDEDGIGVWDWGLAWYVCMRACAAVSC